VTVHQGLKQDRSQGRQPEQAHYSDEEAFDKKDKYRDQSFSSSAHAAKYERKRMDAMLAKPLADTHMPGAAKWEKHKLSSRLWWRQRISVLFKSVLYWLLKRPHSRGVMA